ILLCNSYDKDVVICISYAFKWLHPCTFHFFSCGATSSSVSPFYKGIIEKKAEHLATTSYVLATAYYIVSYIIKVRMFMCAL
ncbi:MAG: hypothetical protein KA235_04730, partial [Prevotella sp.]|nr:hypothetical protein [Prevotella sp.]